ncbi:Phytanoyl-CoA dioxygenase [Pleurostoma richardsiae]|uniref:Phytanoyl-CoA dioxygenase n=1 Tax=Pleurostoma richardsiae TaxID=41990 RepID=A0AA38RD28_9PEZI|nr:Phytanoyl-CoA dioxygenase [Pleurostoma richardsiae]
MTVDWYQKFLRDGYAVIPAVISQDKAEGYQQAAFEWLRSFDNVDLDLSDRSTWITSNLPYISDINTFNHYGVVHERFMWDIRQEPEIIGVFSKLWETDELLVSFDALNITLPQRPGHVPRIKWPHVDQSPYRDGQQCVQGIVNLSKAGPHDGGLTVYPGSHLVTEAFFKEHTDRSTWERKDFYRYSEKEIAWFEQQGYKEHKVLAEPGDLIIWDSRLIHYGAEPTDKSNTIRTVVYVSYAPVWFASEEAVARKREAFQNWLATTHWPHDNIVLRSNKPLFPDGTIDNRRTEPLDKPDLTPALLRLAGMETY